MSKVLGRGEKFVENEEWGKVFCFIVMIRRISII